VDVARLAGEAFGAGRLDILKALESGTERYTGLAKKLRISEGELSRNLGRLVEVGLAVKRPDASYVLTSLARAVLAQAPNLEFLAQHVRFVGSHAFDQLPPRFLRRLDDLACGTYVDGPLPLFKAFQDVGRSIEKRFWAQWIIGQTAFKDDELDIQRELAQRIVAKRPEVRVVAMEDEVPLYHDLVSSFEALVQARTVPSAPTSIALSDTAGLIHFNDLGGRIDAGTGFFGTHPRFLAFLSDLIDDGWAQGAPTRLVRPRPTTRGA
jgi:predicted transcriptional regulator